MNSDRIAQTAKKIKEFSFAQSDWHYGEGKTPKPEIVTIALTLNNELSNAGFTKTNAFLGLDGEIRVTAYHNSIYFELTIAPNGEIVLLLENDDEEIDYAENISLDKACQYVKKLRETIWSSSASSTATTTIPIEGASKVSPLSRQVTAVESPLST